MSMSPTIRWTLLLSLLLNVALLAVLATWWAGQRDSAGPVATTATPADTAHRERFRAAMAPHRERIREHAAEVDRARSEVAGVLQAEPLDAAALETAFTRLREAEAAAARASHVALAETAQALDADGRARMAQRIEQGPRHRRDRGTRRR